MTQQKTPCLDCRLSPCCCDEVNRPAHYCSHPSGVECIQIAEHHDFCVGNVLKYCWRAGLKEQGGQLESELKDLRKARWYLNRKIARLEVQLHTRGPK